MQIKDVVLNEETVAIKTFLKRFNLVYEDDIDLTLVLKDGETIIATVSAAKNIVKCVAIEPSHQGEGLLNQIMSTLIKRLNKRGHTHLFLYTQPEHVDIFETLGFKKIVETMNLSFMELGGDIQKTLSALKDAHNLDKTPKGAVVINANPLTKGHMHLIKEAKKNHDHLLVFVVSEDRSFFPFDVRFSIIEEALGDEDNITILPTKDYLVSYATFPKYFLKHESTIKKEHALIDVLVFKQYYMKIFNITDRYVGDEPYSPMTNTYNKTMKQYLNGELHIIERKSIEDIPISASTVRRILRHQDVESVKRYVPEATLKFLKSDKGHAIIKEIKNREERH